MSTKLLEKLDILEYHAMKDYLSKSMLVDLLPPSCPRKFHSLHREGGKKKDTKQLRIGNAVHVLALEPERFALEYHVLRQDMTRNPKNSKYKKQLEIAENRIVLSKKEYAKVLGMAEALRKNKTALAFLDAPGMIESSILWEQNGINFRCRPDFLRSDGLIIDLKTTHSANQKNFERIADDKHYALSVALTCRGYKALYGEEPKNYVFLCIETEEPYIIEAYDSFRPFDGFGTTYKDVGEYMLEDVIRLYRACNDNNIWPTYNRKPTTPLGFPPYKKKFLATGT